MDNKIIKSRAESSTIAHFKTGLSTLLNLYDTDIADETQFFMILSIKLYFFNFFKKKNNLEQ